MLSGQRKLLNNLLPFGLHTIHSVCEEDSFHEVSDSFRKQGGSIEIKAGVHGNDESSIQIDGECDEEDEEIADEIQDSVSLVETVEEKVQGRESISRGLIGKGGNALIFEATRNR